MTEVQAAGSKYKIGEGSFGKVYRYKYDNQEYAVKKIYKDTKNHPELAEKLEAQGRIMQKVSNHRNVVGFLGEMTKGKYLYLLTQLVPHGDLRKIKSVPCEDDVWEMIMQLTMVLQHLRKNNIIHRDIKPENILIKQIHNQGNEVEMILKLADFGLAETVAEGQCIQGLAGSPIYLAPEMCSHSLYSYEVDMWSLGITLYQLVNQQRSPYQPDLLDYMAAQPNFKQKQLFDYLLNLIQTKKIVCQSQYSEINAVIQSMLNQDPKKRLTPFQLLRHPKVIEKIAKFNETRKNYMKMDKGFSASTKVQMSQDSSKENNSRCNSNSPPPKIQQKKDHNMQLSYSPSRHSQSLLLLSSRLTRSFISQLNQTDSSVRLSQEFQMISIDQ